MLVLGLVRRGVEAGVVGFVFRGSSFQSSRPNLVHKFFMFHRWRHEIWELTDVRAEGGIRKLIAIACNHLADRRTVEDYQQLTRSFPAHFLSAACLRTCMLAGESLNMRGDTALGLACTGVWLLVRNLPFGPPSLQRVLDPFLDHIKAVAPDPAEHLRQDLLAL